MLDQFRADEIIDLIKKSPKSNGAWNLFVKLNDKIGLKLCVSKHQRDGNFDRQTRAAKIGLGPDTYGTIEVEYDGQVLYGYFTEVVPVARDMRNTVLYGIACLHGSYDDLAEEIDVIFEFSDNHARNIGIKNGRFICIDFDDLDENEDDHYETGYKLNALMAE